jgi:hypothetical protein
MPSETIYRHYVNITERGLAREWGKLCNWLLIGGQSEELRAHLASR